MSKKNCSVNRTSIGGQALIEGVMMRGKKITAMTVRLPDNSIDTEIMENQMLKDKYKFFGLPFVRGCVNFVESLVFGYKCLMKSAEKAGVDDESDKQKEGKIFSVLSVVAMFIGVILALLLFMYIPALITKLFSTYLFDLGYFKATFEGMIKIVVFIVYLFVVSLMSDIRRVFQYHGAEHKSIACFEHGDDLTPENAKKYTRLHPRCGTSFTINVLLISIIINSFVPVWYLALRTIINLLVIPLIVSISYEFIKLSAKHENIITRVLSAPGMWLQKLTTKEPDESQLEIAITALKTVIEDEAENNNDVKESL